MRYMGAVKTLKQAISRGADIAKKEKHTFVYEKAKCKDESGKLHVCYRGWLDLTSNQPKVISYEEWKRGR